MTKQEARTEYRKRRKALSQGELASKSKSISNLLFSHLPVHRYSLVHLFLPITQNNEPNTHLILDQLIRDFPVDVYISKSLENKELLHVSYTKNTVLEINKWGIKEPTDLKDALNSETFFKKFAKEEILILIPLLAFDKHGNRVGYGGGYYDRFLEYSSTNTSKIGLSLLDPIDQIVDANSQDVKMDFCITPTKIWQWKKTI